MYILPLSVQKPEVPPVPTALSVWAFWSVYLLSGYSWILEQERWRWQISYMIQPDFAIMTYPVLKKKTYIFKAHNIMTFKYFWTNESTVTKLKLFWLLLQLSYSLVYTGPNSIILGFRSAASQDAVEGFESLDWRKGKFSNPPPQLFFFIWYFFYWQMSGHCRTRWASSVQELPTNGMWKVVTGQRT